MTGSPWRWSTLLDRGARGLILARRGNLNTRQVYKLAASLSSTLPPECSILVCVVHCILCSPHEPLSAFCRAHVISINLLNSAVCHAQGISHSFVSLMKKFCTQDILLSSVELAFSKWPFLVSARCFLQRANDIFCRKISRGHIFLFLSWC